MIKVSCTSFNQLSACLGAIFSGQWQPLMVSGVSAVSKGSSLWQRLPTVKGTRCRGCCVPAMVCARPENRSCTRGARCTVGPSLRATAEAWMGYALTSNGQTCSFTQQQTDALTMKKWDSSKMVELTIYFPQINGSFRWKQWWLTSGWNIPHCQTKNRKTYVRLSSYMGFVNYGNECA